MSIIPICHCKSCISASAGKVCNFLFGVRTDDGGGSEDGGDNLTFAGRCVGGPDPAAYCRGNLTGASIDVLAPVADVAPADSEYFPAGHAEHASAPTESL